MPVHDPIERAYALAAKVQPSRGTPSVPTMADDAIRLAQSFEVRTNWVSENKMEGEQVGGKGSYPSGQRAGRIFETTVRRRMRGPGTVISAANLPAEDPLLMAVLGSLNVDTTGGAERAQYSGTDDQEPLLTVLAQTMKQEFTAEDVVAKSASLEWESGKFMDLVVELAGVGAAPTQQVLEAAGLDTHPSVIYRGGSFTLNGVALKPIKGTLDFGLSISEPLLDGTASDAWAGYKITDRSPTGTMEIRPVDLADFDPWALMTASTPIPWLMRMGGAQYRDIQIEADRLEITSVGEVNRGGSKAWSLGFMIHRAIAPSVKDPLLSYL